MSTELLWLDDVARTRPRHAAHIRRANTIGSYPFPSPSLTYSRSPVWHTSLDQRTSIIFRRPTRARPGPATTQPRPIATTSPSTQSQAHRSPEPFPPPQPVTDSRACASPAAQPPCTSGRQLARTLLRRHGRENSPLQSHAQRARLFLRHRYPSTRRPLSTLRRSHSARSLAGSVTSEDSVPEEPEQTGPVPNRVYRQGGAVMEVEIEGRGGASVELEPGLKGPASSFTEPGDDASHVEVGSVSGSLSSTSSSASSEAFERAVSRRLPALWEGFWAQQANWNDLVGSEVVAKGFTQERYLRDEAVDLLWEMLFQLNTGNGLSCRWIVRSEQAFYASPEHPNIPPTVDVAVYARGGERGHVRERDMKLIVEVKKFGRGIDWSKREADKQIRRRARQAAEARELDRLIMVSLIGPFMRIYYWQRGEPGSDDEALGTIRPHNTPQVETSSRVLSRPLSSNLWQPLSLPLVRRMLQQVVIDCQRSVNGQPPRYPWMYGKPGSGPTQEPSEKSSDSTVLSESSAEGEGSDDEDYVPSDTDSDSSNAS